MENINNIRRIQFSDKTRRSKHFCEDNKPRKYIISLSGVSLHINQPIVMIYYDQILVALTIRSEIERIIMKTMFQSISINKWMNDNNLDQVFINIIRQKKFNKREAKEYVEFWRT
jgi:hypothetical protein